MYPSDRNPIIEVQKPRHVRSAQLFWLSMPVAFTSTPNEQVIAATETEGFSTIVRGAWSDLSLARVRFQVLGPDREFSQVQIPIQNVVGQSASAVPIRYWGNPFLLQARQKIQGNFLNFGSEAAGTVCFLSEKFVGGEPVKLDVSYSSWLQLDLGVSPAFTLELDDDCLIWGAMTNCENDVRVLISDSSSRVAWSEQAIPVRALAGLEGSAQPLMRYNRPYFLRSFVQIRADLATPPVTGDFISFMIERISLPRPKPV